MRVLDVLNPFNKKANNQAAWSYDPKFSDGLKHPFVHFLWDQMIHHKKFNEGGLKHRFYSKAYNLIYTPEMQAENLASNRLDTLKSQAVYFVNHLPLGEEQLFDDPKALEQFIENHVGFNKKQVHGITAKEIADQISKEPDAILKSMERRQHLLGDCSEPEIN